MIRARALARSFALGAVALTSAGCSSTLPSSPEVIVSVDTDVPVPLVVSRLRIDLYAEDGTWFATSDVARPDPRDWPASFAVVSDDPSRTRRVAVRLRAYRDGRVRDYRGEAPHVWDGPANPIGTTDAPRLVKDGSDLTPLTEPDPLIAIDRMIVVSVGGETVARADVVLHGACAGTSVVFGSDPSTLALDQATTCVEDAKTLVPLADAALGPALTIAPPSVAGTWLADACPTPDGASERVCIPGGATILGTPDHLSSVEVAAQPERVFGLHTFDLDRYELTVGRYRDALARGFTTKEGPIANEAALSDQGTGACTWSKAPRGREDMALNCIRWPAARAICNFLGGDLPTEAQWEHAATIAGHAEKTHYPWGNDEPDCDRAAFGRQVTGGMVGKCIAKGPLPPTRAESARDVSPLGVLALAAGLSEWIADSARDYADPCWLGASIVDPSCTVASKEKIIRGANFILPEMVHATIRLSDMPTIWAPALGFRCAYARGGGS